MVLLKLERRKEMNKIEIIGAIILAGVCICVVAYAVRKMIKSILISKEICPYCRGKLTTVSEGEETRVCGRSMGSFTAENLRTYCTSCGKTIKEECVNGYWDHS